MTGNSLSRGWGMLLVLSFVGTMVVGVWLRWALTGVAGLPAPFVYLRHAHSHLGYFGLLFPLAWLGWKAVDGPVLGRLGLGIYAVSTAVAFVGFTLSGYGPVAIVGSTLVGGIWFFSAIPLVPRMKHLYDPLGAVPLGVVLSLACVPPIAMTLRSNPGFAQGFVATFLASLLLLVIVPSALASRRIPLGPWPLFLAAGVMGALALGVAPGVITRGGLLVYGGLLLSPIFSRNLPTDVRATWLAISFGLMGIALGWVPNSRSVALGATHFLILGPLLATLSPHWLRNLPRPWVWWCGHTMWGTMSFALVAQEFGAGQWTWIAAAAGGTGTLLWWGAVLVYQNVGQKTTAAE